jgi:hypothetical protein
MKLTKEEKNLLAINNLFNEFKENFPTVSFISLRVLNGINNKKIKFKENIFPFFLYVVIKNSTVSSDRFYSWAEGSCDDEYPLYDKNGEYYGYHEVKNFVQNKIPEAFKGKSFYKEDFEMDSHDLPSLITPIKAKLDILELDKHLKINKKNERKLKL